MGRPSGGLAVRDFDDAEAYHTWAALHPEDAACLPTVRTGRGFHLYGRLAEEKYDGKFGDGELRADQGHYCLLPPSLHPSGIFYRWLVPLPPIRLALPLLPSSLTQHHTQVAHATQRHALQIGTGHVAEEWPGEVMAAVEAAISATLPTGYGQRTRKLFHFARYLRAIPELASLPCARLRVFVQAWWERALPHIKTKDFETTWIDFAISWRNVRYPAGQGGRQAAAAAAAAPPLPAAAVAYARQEVRQLVALCRQLQLLRGDQPFFLGCRDAAEAIGCDDPGTAWRWLKMLVADGLLVEVERGIPHKGSGKATAWQYFGD